MIEVLILTCSSIEVVNIERLVINMADDKLSHIARTPDGVALRGDNADGETVELTTGGGNGDQSSGTDSDGTEYTVVSEVSDDSSSPPESSSDSEE